MLGYPLDRLHAEVAFIAYYFHWPAEQLLAMEHRDRRQWVDEISRINQELSEPQGP